MLQGVAEVSETGPAIASTTDCIRDEAAETCAVWSLRSACIAPDPSSACSSFQRFRDSAARPNMVGSLLSAHALKSL